MAMPNCLVLLKQAIAFARSFAWFKAGSNKAARMAIIAMTTSNSIKVKADFKDAALASLWENFKYWLNNSFLSSCPGLAVILRFII